MDLYIPRKWELCALVLYMQGCSFACSCGSYSQICLINCSSATNRLITLKDHASVQMNISHLSADGVYTNQYTTFDLCGFIRAHVSWCA